jgi:hypothetical protein
VVTRGLVLDVAAVNGFEFTEGAVCNRDGALLVSLPNTNTI